MEPERWAEQWARVNRWLSVIEQTNAGRTHTRESDAYQDELYAFFQNCYHLKDWLKNSGAVTPDHVESFVRGSESLRICGDLCNGSKHLTLKWPRERHDVAIGERHFALEVGSGPPTISVKYEVTVGDKTYDAFSLAESCMAGWQGYLTSKGLL